MRHTWLYPGFFIEVIMKKSFFLLSLAACLALCGCVGRQYVITTNNGRTIKAASKPKLQGGNWVYKDAAGNPAYVSAGRVREIAPASMVDESKPNFRPTPGR